MKFTIVPCLYNKPDYLQNPCRFYVLTSRRLWLWSSLFSTTEFQSCPHSQNRHYKKSHCKIEDLAVIHRRRYMSFATVSVTKRQQVVKLLGIPEGENCWRSWNRSKWETSGLPHTDVQGTKCLEGIKKISGVTSCFVSGLFRETLEEIAMEANHEFKVHGGGILGSSMFKWWWCLVQHCAIDHWMGSCWKDECIKVAVSAEELGTENIKNSS
jgi:ferrochelatase